MRLAAAALLTVGLAFAARAETVTLDQGNMIQLTVLMLDRGLPERALEFAEAMLLRDPQDPVALVLKSRALRDMGQPRGAQGAARLAWNHAGSNAEKFSAALSMAQGLSSGGQKWRAQLWLRRAMQVAPDEAARRIAERDFDYVRSRSRLWLQFDATVQPSSNVNNGSSQDIIWFYGLPLELSGGSKALSGMEGSLGINARYRLRESADAKTDLRIGAVQTMVWLSDSAKAQAPEARGSDFAFSSLTLGLERAWKAGSGLELTASGTLGRTWYGGDPLAHVTRLSFGARKVLGPRSSLDATLALDRQDRQDSPVSGSENVTLTLGATRILATQDRLDLTMNLRDSRSDSVEVAHDMARLRLDWTRADPIMGARLSLGAWAEMRDYPGSRYTPGGRQDQIFGTELSMTFETIDYMGFVPVMTLSASRNGSNVALYESENLGLGLSVRSKF